MIEVSSCIRGLHVYKEIWEPCICEELVCSRQLNNPHDCYAVAVCKTGTTVGHVPKILSRLCWLFLNKSGTEIKCFVTGTRRYSSDWLKVVLRYHAGLSLLEELLNKLLKLLLI
uniref:HIRAN domain-containing protein n=1 Tax=Amphimedon queenslandica TaxID=400682 RepID=A0A1X7VGL8_AMPQE